ncbi:MAG: hypothetical protein BHV81_00320 [Butyricimonas synergistica]|nr:MAG: hypothetical protein BHV81_00320 [Butyricimonas synergistica]
MIKLETNKMKEPQEFIPDEDLKSFFLAGTLFLDLSEKLEQQEYNRLRVLYKLHKNVHDLLFQFYQCNLNMRCLDVCEVFGFYFVEKEGEKKKKHHMSARLYACTRFIQQIIKYCDLGKVIIIFTNTVVGVILLYILLQMH